MPSAVSSGHVTTLDVAQPAATPAAWEFRGRPGRPGRSSGQVPAVASELGRGRWPGSQTLSLLDLHPDIAAAVHLALCRPTEFVHESPSALQSL